MVNYGVFIDTNMIYNVAETDYAETGELLNSGLLLHVALMGILPAFVIYKTDIRYYSPLKQAAINGVFILGSLGLIGANLLVFSSGYASFFRNHHQVRYLVNPVNYIYSVGNYIAGELRTHDDSLVAIGTDAHQIRSASPGSKKQLIVVVVGETARAMNFSLNGYVRDTNPNLRKEAILNFPNFYSCGTTTHVSLPCMFSMFDRDDFDEAGAKRYEKLPDVLKRAGIDVLWRDNNSGCKGVCDNVPSEDLSHMHIDGICNDARCHDEVLLVDLRKRLEKQKRDTVIILHQNGSHGPAYYRRYPRDFGRFVPECTSDELNECRTEEIVNSYDNTILYTDHFLARVISFLKEESDTFDTAMVYVSDHGESLGEHNIYLHGIPYVIAPEEQKHVPFIVWFSGSFASHNRLDIACIRQRASRRYSHDNLFHSLLGLNHVATSVYRPDLDIFKHCRV
jgi:lipid A ethanolaminephosphotransferase